MATSLSPAPSCPVASTPEESHEIEQFLTKYGTVRVVRRAHLLHTPTWRSVFERHGKDHRFYEIAEQTLGGQFDQRYLVIEDRTGRTRAIQPFFFVDQDLCAGLPVRMRSLFGGIRRGFSRFMKMRMLMVGCVAAEGHLSATDEWSVAALHEALRVYARRSASSMIVLKDFPKHYRDSLAPFSNDGYKRVPSMPGAQLHLDFSSFEDYMKTKLGRIFRKNLRRKFKKLSQRTALEMEVVNDVAHVAGEVYPLYLQTYSRSTFQFEKLTLEFFTELGRRMADRARFFLWRQGGRIVAFSTCIEHEGALYDLAIGMDYAVALDLHLYFVTWRDIIEWAIARKLQTYQTGPLNYDPKLHLRLDLCPLDIYACHTSPLINPLFRIAIQYLQPARHDPTIRRFPNAHEL